MDLQQRKLRILCVDDDPISRALLHDHLAAAGHEVFLADNAHAAVAFLRREPAQIVIADWVMPSMSGIELCRWVRSQTARNTHFVMLTVHSDRQRLIEAFEAGVDDFLSKPLHEGELLARLRAWGRLIHLQEQLAALAASDELTGLPNRREAMRRLNECWAASERYGDALCCGIVDIDGFKGFNDRHGHIVGDQVLRHVAGLLKAFVRSCDGVFRLGGDEFLILFDRQTIGHAAISAQRCREAVALQTMQLGDTSLQTTISIGLAQRDKGTDCVQSLLDSADRALYEAKLAGKNTVAPPALRCA